VGSYSVCYTECPNETPIKTLQNECVAECVGENNFIDPLTNICLTCNDLIDGCAVEGCFLDKTIATVESNWRCKHCSSEKPLPNRHLNRCTANCLYNETKYNTTDLGEICIECPEGCNNCTIDDTGKIK
jgi:hypothetical protein